VKLYLSSHKVPTPDDLVALVGKKPADTKVILIMNAKDYYIERVRDFKLGEMVEYFNTLGYQPDELDLRKYRDDGRAIESLLEKYDLIWVAGGNTFMLRDEMSRTGFDWAIARLLEKGIVYGGSSAGAIVMGNSLKGIEYADEPQFAEFLVDEAVGLLDRFILPHVGSAMFGDAIEKARELHKDDPTLLELTDTQALVVNGDDMKVVEAK
jgi:dipeptidase E